MKAPTERRVYESPLREEQAAATRERILAALADILVSENPASISVPVVAERARVSVRTVYRHFPTKDDLYRELFVWAVDVRGAGLPSLEGISGVDDLARVTRQMFQGIGRHPELHRAADKLPEARAQRAARAPWRREAVEAAMRDATAELPPESARKVHAVAHLLTASDALLFMQEYWGLDPDEAADASVWAVRALAIWARSRKGP